MMVKVSLSYTKREPVLFSIGDKVETRSADDKYEGRVRSNVLMTSGAIRYAVENDKGGLRTFSGDELRRLKKKREKKEKKKGKRKGKRK